MGARLPWHPLTYTPAPYQSAPAAPISGEQEGQRRSPAVVEKEFCLRLCCAVGSA